MSSTPESIHLEDWIRDIPDFPQRGILFKDITPLLQDAKAFRAALDRLAAHYAGAGIQTVVGVESRGFILGAPLAYLLNCGFVPVRKFGKLPSQTVSVEYALEYGTNVVQMHPPAPDPATASHAHHRQHHPCATCQPARSPLPSAAYSQPLPPLLQYSQSRLPSAVQDVLPPLQSLLVSAIAWCAPLSALLL